MSAGDGRRGDGYLLNPCRLSLALGLHTRVIAIFRGEQAGSEWVSWASTSLARCSAPLISPHPNLSARKLFSYNPHFFFPDKENEAQRGLRACFRSQASKRLS